LVYPILAAAAANAQPTFAMPEDDPAQLANAQLIELLFSKNGILNNSIEGIDRNYLYPAIRMATNHPLGGGRKMREMYTLLTDEDINALADAVVDAIHFQAPGDTMGSAVVRNEGLKMLQSRNIAEGVPLAEVMSDTDGRANVSRQAIEVLASYAGSSLLVQPDPRTIDFLRDFWGSDYIWDGNLWPDALAALNAIAADTNPVAPTPFKSIQSVTTDAPTLTLPVNRTKLRVKAFDYAKGDSRFTWRKIHGAGEVSFFPNATASSKNTNVLFDSTPGQYLFEVTMSDSRGFTEVSQTVAVTLRDSSGNLPANSPPTAHALALTIGEATPTPITLTGHDPEGYALNFKVTAQPANGTLSGTAPYLIYTSNFNYTGPDSFTFEVMDSEGQVATATVSITVGAAAPTGLAIYEPFDYPAGPLNGKSGTSEVGFSGSWTTPIDASILSDSIGYGPLPTKGGKFTASNPSGSSWGARRSISPSALAGNGLLADGATLWFSATAGSLATGNASLSIALANSPFATGGGQRYIQNEGAQLGAGIGFQFSIPSGFAAATFGNTSGSTVSASGDSAKTKYYYNGDSGMVVGKITWGATPEDFDTIEIYEPQTDLLLPARPTTVLTTKVDQSTFDTLAIYRGGTPLLDEVRFGSNYQSVLLGSVAMTADSSPPIPNPIGFHMSPAPSGTSSVRMVATSAYDPNGVEYYFTCTAGGGHDSGWQSSPEYTDTGLTPGVAYSYTVKARDLSPARNETAPSTAFSATIPTSTLVPVVLNLSQAEAEAIITSEGFTVGSITTAPSSSVDEGDVSAQTPAGGTSAALGTAVDLVISETVQLATVPNVVGQTQSPAATTLAAQDFLVGTVFTDYSETVPAGQIMGTNPAAGTQVAFGTTVNLLVSAGTSSGLLPLTELLLEDFESPSSPVAYVQGSLPDNGKWVGSTVGFQPGWRGITDKAGGDFSAPDPNHQAFALRYKQSGITTAQGAIGMLTLNTRYSLSFDVMRDGIRSPGTRYFCELVAFDPGSTRADATSGRPGYVLASATGNAPSDGSIARISLEFTALASNPHLGKDIGIRFVAPTTDTNALIDNVSLRAVGVPLADTVPPTLLATHPADDATEFPINEFPTLTFSEPIAAGTGAVLLRNVTDGIQQFLLTSDPSVAIITGSTLRLLPPGGLQANKDYTVLVDLGAVSDLAGNRFAGISDPTAWNFTTSATDISPPTLTIANEQTSDTVYVGDVVTYTLAFSERIDGATLDSGDFSNAGTSSISIGTIIENSPGLFSVLVTPTSSGTLQLQVNAGAVITDLASNALDTTSPIADEGVITVIPPNLAPVWAGNPINKTAVNVGVSYSGTLANDASDAENDPLIFAKISGPAWLSVAANGTLSGTPTLNDVGPNSFTVGVSDGISPAVQATLNISVLPLIDPTPSSLFLYFDGGTIDIDGAGNGASAGGVGTWNTTIKNWDAGVGNPYVAWNNTNGDNAVIAGTGILTVGVPVTVGTLTATSSGGTRTISGSEITINNGINLGFLAGFSVTAPIKLGGSQTWIHNQGAANSTGKSITGGTALNYRTLTWETTNGASSNRVTHSNISGSGSIIKKGTGWLGLGGTNTFTGSTTINAGTIDATSSTALGNANNQLIVNTSGTLNMSGVSLSVGNLTGTGGVITSTSTSGTRTFTIGSGDTGGGNFQGIIQNGTTGSTTALTKTGTGTITLSGSNTYTGATIINNGTLFLSGATQGTTSITFTGGSLGLDTGFPVTAASAGVNLSNGTIKVTGAPVAASYTLLAASSITGTPVLADPIAGYALQVVGGTELRLVVAVLPNQPPVFTANPLLGADAIEGTAYTATLAGTATDDNDDTLTYAKVSGPVWLSVAEDGTLTGTPTNSDVGLNEFTVSVSDGIAAAVEATLSITVINTNDAPVWASNPVIGPDAAVSEGYLATLAGFASDVDAGAVLAFSVVDGPAWLSVDSDGTLSGTPDIGGLNVFTVSVSDGIAEPVNATLHITVIGISDEQMWKTSFGEADLSDLSADYDGDGLSNGEERIWGLDPTKGSSRNPIVTPLDPATGKFRYSRRDPVRTGKKFTIWTSGNLADWTQDTAAIQSRGPMVDFIETVEVTLTAAPVNGRLFVRVQASD
jgi:autotransporter-associated beta strand protein